MRTPDAPAPESPAVVPMAATCFIIFAAFGACHDLPSGGEKESLSGGVVELFRVEVPPGFRFHRPALDDERLYADLAEASGVVALDRVTGEEVWRYDRPFGGPASLSIHRGRVLFTGEYAIALDSGSGAEIWRYRPNAVGALGESDAHDGGFYFGTDQRIYALDVEDGSVSWWTDVGPDWEFRSIVRGVSVGGDTIYASIERYLAANGHLAVGYVVALDRHTGALLWTYQEGQGADRRWFRTAPRVAADLLLLSDREANVYVTLDRMTGELLWRTPGEPGYFGAADPPRLSGDTVYAASADRMVIAMARETGEVLWRTRLGGSVRSLALCGRRILAVDQGFHVLDRLTGTHMTALYDEASSMPTLWVSAFAGDGNKAYVLGNRHAFAYECPD